MTTEKPNLDNPLQNEAKLSPQERTTQLFSQEYLDLAHTLVGRTIINSNDSSKRITIQDTQEFSRKDNEKGSSWAVLTSDERKTGEFIVAKYARFPNARIPLITALENGELGACVGITKADLINAKGKQITSDKKTEICSALGLDEGVFTLGFRDDTEDLYVMLIPTVEPTEEAVEDANDFLDNL